MSNTGLSVEDQMHKERVAIASARAGMLLPDKNMALLAVLEQMKISVTSADPIIRTIRGLDLTAYEPDKSRNLEGDQTKTRTRWVKDGHVQSSGADRGRTFKIVQNNVSERPIEIVRRGDSYFVAKAAFDSQG